MIALCSWYFKVLDDFMFPSFPEPDTSVSLAQGFPGYRTMNLFFLPSDLQVPPIQLPSSATRMIF